METGVLCYLLRENKSGDTEVCLAIKKKKVGAGLWNGYGGHRERSELALDAAVRETKEEARVRIPLNALQAVAFVYYYERDERRIPHSATHNLKWLVQIFTTRVWKGEPKATVEMGTPQWFPWHKIPYEQMMPSDRFILPLLLAGTKLEAEVYYGIGKKSLENIFMTPLTPLT